MNCVRCSVELTSENTIVCMACLLGVCTLCFDNHWAAHPDTPVIVVPEDTMH